MFTQTTSAPSATGLASVTVSTTLSHARSSRLRLSTYFRNYTQSHLLLREPAAGSSSAAAPSHHQERSHSPPSFAQDFPFNLSRSASQSPTTSGSNREASSKNNQQARKSRFSLVLTSTFPFTSAQGSQSVGSESIAVPTTVERQLSEPPRSILPLATDEAIPTVMARTRTMAATGNDTILTSPLTSLVGADGSQPSIRFSTYHDTRTPRPSLYFEPIARTLPTGTEVIKVGRYSERDAQPGNTASNVASAAPVGFKSKVVSRRHCEFWCEAGKWYIKDVKSSSGTFLNHIRLSPPNTESRPYPINDGDIVQLGIDFKGGEEMIFRCVKMRLELNRGWQTKLNNFNMATHKRLRNMTSNSASSGSYSQDCSICLNRISPCQSLFVAPCSHTWHYKCIRALLVAPSAPIFVCPNCRGSADLDADVEDPIDWEAIEAEEAEQQKKKLKEEESGAKAAPAEVSQEAESSSAAVEPSEQSEAVTNGGAIVMDDAPPMSNSIIMEDSSGDSGNSSDTPSSQPSDCQTTSNSVSIPISTDGASAAHNHRPSSSRAPSPTDGPAINVEGPITPRNDVGPWVFDGSALRPGASATVAVVGPAPRMNNTGAAVAGDEVF